MGALRWAPSASQGGGAFLQWLGKLRLNGMSQEEVGALGQARNEVLKAAGGGCWGPRRSGGSRGRGSSVRPNCRNLIAWETTQEGVLPVALDMAGSILQAILPGDSEKAHPPARTPRGPSRPPPFTAQ